LFCLKDGLLAAVGVQEYFYLKAVPYVELYQAFSLKMAHRKEQSN
jgi:hypothetical protein